MKRATAIRNLVEMATIASENLRWRDSDVLQWPLVSMWAAGGLLDRPESIEWPRVVLLMDIPAEELPWLARHELADAVCRELRLGKRSVAWCCRPSAWPAWNVDDRRVLRFWSDTGGLDEAVIEVLRSGPATEPLKPTDEELAAQLRAERPLSAAHLAEVLDRYHDREWRRTHRGEGSYPEDHLWAAAQGLREIDEALGAG